MSKFSLEWNSIRAINGSQRDGFEELVCQLARYELVLAGSLYRRKGKPDAGVECFWILPDGREWVWQAKFFTSSPGSTQWGELDKSVRTLLEKHPQVTKVTIAIPIDLPDARIKGKKSAQEKWVTHVKKWEGWALAQDLTVEFEYWGEHALLERLSKDIHRGRVLFWFNQLLFNHSWFTNKIEESIADAGPRYTPEINVELPIVQKFDGLGRTEAFFVRTKQWAAQIIEKQPSIHQVKDFPKVTAALEIVYQKIDRIRQSIIAIDECLMDTLDWNSLIQIIGETQEKIDNCEAEVREQLSKFRPDEEGRSSSGQHQPKPQDLLEDLVYQLRELSRTLRDAEDFFRSEEALLANNGTMLLVGEAGKGKTHLFCDVARYRNEKQLPTILLLGEYFANNGDIWRQILDILDLSNHSREEFLGALEAAAQVRGKKAVILIDALNESVPLTMWRKRLRSFLKIIERYKWISVAISVRSSYESFVIPDDIDNQQMIRVEHRGFAEMEYEATRQFFDYYGIEQPSVPALNPEFQTPLFLKLFCQGLKNRNLTRIPKGLRGITAIFDFFIDSIEEHLQSPEKLNLSPHANTVRQAIHRISKVMAERLIEWIPINEAETIINDLHPYSGYTNSLFYHLISEGLLSKDRFRANTGNEVEGVRFSYQRLSDHLIARYLLNAYLDETNPSNSFTEGAPLWRFMSGEKRWLGSGIIEAFSIQIPERTGRELFDIAPSMDKNWLAYDAFIKSVLWRNPNAITETTLVYANEAFQFDRTFWDKFLNVLLTLAVEPDHPYNADFLYSRLMKKSMGDRDAVWSTFLYEQYGEKTSVDRLIDWAWSPADKSHIEDDSIRLAGVALSWFLTTSHRFVRDRATKALVNLLAPKLHILRAVLKQFREVDDLYVLERLMAVAYGCVMRSDDHIQIQLLAQEIYDWIFSNNSPPTHILFRDYARGVVEYAISQGLSISGEVEKIRPPYASDWVTIPTQEEIDALELPGGSWDSHDGSWAHNRIIWSVMWDDFGRYIIGTNSGTFPWLSLPINEVWKPAEYPQKLERFIDSLTSEQRLAWEAYMGVRLKQSKNTRDYHVTIDPNEVKIVERPMLDEDSPSQDVEYERIQNEKKALQEAEGTFLRTLDENKLNYFESYILPILKRPGDVKNGPQFDLSAIQRWVIKRVFELGWTKERFGWFDHWVVGISGRDAHKPERIGKKYQWLAYHEILARIADNFQFFDRYSEHSEKNVYQGPWQLSIRDIDPSCVLKEWPKAIQAMVWWAPEQYDSWNYPEKDVDWLQKDDFPNIESFINVINPMDNHNWLTLCGIYAWEQPIPPGIASRQFTRRHTWCYVFGYLVHIQDRDKVFRWAATQDFYGHWMPKGQSFHPFEVFLGELYWSPAYVYQKDPYMGDYGWQIARHLHTESPKPIMPLWAEYSTSDFGFDCSIDDSLSIYLPTKFLKEGLEIKWRTGGNFYDNTGALVAFDPSIFESGPNALLVRKDRFRKFLVDNSLDVFWIALGGKNLIGGDIIRDDWQGELRMSGAYITENGKVKGTRNVKFIEPRPK